MNNKILDNISFIVGGLTLVLVVVLQKNMPVALIVGGIGATIYGILEIIKNNKVGYMVFSIGTSLLVTLGIYLNNILDITDSITFMMCLFLIMVIITSFIFYILSDKISKNKHSLEINAQVVDLIRNPNTTKEYYQPVYTYEVDGELYDVSAIGFMDKNVPKIGDTTLIYVNPKDSTDVYFPARLKDKLYIIALCCVLIIVSVIIIVTLF